MYGESTGHEAASTPKKERTTLSDLLQRDEPSMAEFVLKAADTLNLKLQDAESRATAAETRASAAEEELMLDQDTGLWTEQKFNQEVDAWIHRSGANPDTQIAIVFIDMNNLKIINDTLGHRAGDDAIRELAVKLRNIAEHGLRADDFRAISRSNKAGDEFMLALPARETDEVREGEDNDELHHTLRDKINALIMAGRENNYYACGCVVATRGDLLERGLDFYKEAADEQMYKNKQRMKQHLQKEKDVGLALNGTHHI